MKRLFLLTIISVLLYGYVYSSGIISAKNKLYNAYITGDINSWKSTINDLRESYKRTGNIFTLYELTKSQYGYMGFLIDRRSFDNAREVIDESEKNINKLLQYNPDWADVHALKAGIYGFKIILFPTQVIINGPKGKDYLEKATSFNELSPSIIVEMANYKYHTPALLGGNVDQAIQYYQYAIKLFELTNQTNNNWQYINTMVWLAISLDKKGESTEAKKVLQEVLKKEPGFDWVKNDLYPKILRNESISRTYFSLSN